MGIDIQSPGADAAALGAALGAIRPRPDLSGLKTPPLASAIGTTWTWRNQNGATAVQDAAGALVLSKVRSASDDWAILTTGLPSTPYNFTVEFDYPVPSDQFPSAGIVFMDTSTGKFLGFVISEDGTNNRCYVTASNWTNATTYSANAGFFTDQPFRGGVRPRWLRIRDTGTNLIAYISFDGVNFIALNTGMARSGFVTTPNAIGFAQDPKSTTSYNWQTGYQMIVRDAYFS